MMLIDRLCYNSTLRYKNAGVKFAFSILTLCICVASRSAAVAIVVLVTAGALTVRKGGVPFSRYLKFLAAPLLFLLLGTLAIMLHLSHSPMDLFAIPIGTWYLTADHASFFYALRLILTALGSVSCLYFLAFTTPMPDILEVLRRLHCPRLLIELMLLIYRFIFILLSTASSISISQDCRLGKKDFRTSLKSFGLLGSVLFLRALSRSNRLYDAMEARCYDGTIRVLSESNPPKRKDIFAVLLFDGLLFLFALWRNFSI